MYITDIMIIQCKMVVTKNCQPVYWTSHWRIFRHKSSLQPIFLFVPTRKWKSFHSLTKCEQQYVIVFNVAYQDVQTYFGRLYGEFYSEYFMEHSLCSVTRKMLITTYNEKKWINYGQRILLRWWASPPKQYTSADARTSRGQFHVAVWYRRPFIRGLGCYSVS